ncbi:hypothetical protein Tco_1031498 [Tanacetum coccineum]|uniref:Uncharacterized protein n=1 Tax=Tanacetum coccineum TaxID=301880 RepID=A0ABQ5G962_9ASTR
MVKPAIGNNVNFEIKSQFMREIREDTLSGNKNDDAHEHVERALDIASLFSILGGSHDPIMLYVFPITLIGIAHHPKPQNNLKRFITSSKKETRHYTKHGKDTTTRQLLDSQGPIPGMTLARALESIQTMADHSQKWHHRSSNRKTSGGSLDGIVAIPSKMDSLGRDMKKLKENVHDIQVGCGHCRRPHLDQEYLFNEEVKGIEEVKYGDFGSSFPSNRGHRARYRMGPPDEETQEVEEVEETQEVEEVKETKEETNSCDLPIITHYVAPYEPQIPFTECLAQHAKEALVIRTMESLREIRVNLPLIKEIRKTDDYAVIRGSSANTVCTRS